MKARLLLEDGTLIEGTSFGAQGETSGEVVFYSSMTGYQEILTNPSNHGLIVVMTYPLIGNYGFNQDDNESLRPHIHGMIVREAAPFASHWQNEQSLHDYFEEYGIIGVTGIDTRMLTRKLRDQGTMKGIISTGDETIEELSKRIQAPSIRDQVARVSTKSIHIAPSYGRRVALIDFGVKHNIQRELVERNCEVISVPYDTSAAEILRLKPHGVILSNGPGDPKEIPEAIRTVQKLLGNVPIFGIGLGHQLLALACGADTEKMKFGHRGNHPVKELATGRIMSTSQNHGYVVKRNSIKGTGLLISHLSINDETVEGLVHESLSAFSVQFYPEAAPGPLDSGYLFDQFHERMEWYVQKGGLNHA